MAINGAVLKNGATLGTTGGTDVTFTQTGTQIPFGIETVDTATTDPRLRKRITCSSRGATYDSNTNTWQKDKRDMRVSTPKTLADGSVVFPLVRMSIELHPEMSDAEIDTLLSLAAQMLFSIAYRNFVKYGSIT